MRIDGKRASEYSQDDILLMLFRGESLSGSPLTDAQKIELVKSIQSECNSHTIINRRM